MQAFEAKYHLLSFGNINILSVVALDETAFLAACISRCKTLKRHVILTTHLGGVTSTSANNLVLFIEVCVMSFTYVSTLCTRVSLPGCSNIYVTNKILYFIRITSGFHCGALKLLEGH